MHVNYAHTLVCIQSVQTVQLKIAHCRQSETGCQDDSMYAQARLRRCGVASCAGMLQAQH